ncbi:MAG: hypothetical protein ACFFCW_05070, partial [Candidatus Hodarchaeota archaeon]
MALSDEQIKELLTWFIEFSKAYKAWSGGRKRAIEENHKWIQPAVIEQMSDEELEKAFLEYYN